MSTKRLTTLARSRMTRGLCVAVLGLPVLWMTRFTAAAPKEPDGKADEQKPAVEMVHVSGVCRNEDGGPLKDVQLQLYRVDARILELSGTEISVAKTTSDGEGRFRFETAIPRTTTRSPQKAYVVVARAKGLASNARRLWPPYGKPDDVEFKLVPGTTLEGTVRDQKGNALAGARVWFFPGPVGGIASGVSDKDGKYRIEDLAAFGPRGKARAAIRVSHPDFGTRIAWTPKIPNTLDIALSPAAIVEGRVVDSRTGKPVPNVWVGAQGIEKGQYYQAVTDAEGKYRLITDEDRYKIMLDHSERPAAAIESFTTVAGETFKAPEIRLIEGATIKGRVIDDETGAAPRFSTDDYPDIAWNGPDYPRGGGVQTTEVKPDGTFEFRVPPGKVLPYFRANAQRWKVEQSTPPLGLGLDVEEGQEIEVVIRVRGPR